MTRPARTRLRAPAAALAAAVSAALAAGPVQAAVPRARVGSLTPRPAGAHVIGRVRPDRRLSVTVAMAPRDPLALAAAATAASTPGSPAFGHHLTVARFARRFGAAPDAAAAVSRDLRDAGLRVGPLTANGLQLPVSGTAADLERAFAVREQRVRLPDGRDAYTAAATPTLPVTIAPAVQAVIGLDDLDPEQPAGVIARRIGHPDRRRGRERDAVSTDGGPELGSVSGCSTPDGEETSGEGESADEIADAYEFGALYGQGDLGAGQTIALYEQDVFDPAVIAAYDRCYGIATTPNVITVGPGPDYPDVDESELDIELIAGMAPDAAIDVYQGSDPIAILGAMVTSRAQVLSSSWGECESQEGGATIEAESTLLQEAAVQGQSFFAASGDSGSSMCDQTTDDDPSPDYSLSVDDPASQPYATGVGGTSLYHAAGATTQPFEPTDADPQTASESVWNNGFRDAGPGSSGHDDYEASASGGGLSAVWAMPTYQSSAASSLGVTAADPSGVACTVAAACREVPDVSADADPESGYIVDTHDYGWAPVGGTSGAAPLWAAFTALANASPACQGTPLGFLNPALYAIAGSAYGDFNDVTAPSVRTGADSNDPFAAGGGPVPDPNGDAFVTRTGYDMATGLGSMRAGPLAEALCAGSDSVTVATPPAQTSALGSPVSLQASATDADGAALTYAAAGLPAGLTINATSGAITGVPTTAATSSVTITATDAGGHAGHSQPFTWTVTAAATTTAPPTTTAPATTTATTTTTVAPATTPTTTTAPATPTRTTATGPLSAVSLRGLATGRPSLRLTYTATAGSAPISRLTITLPGGLSFATRKRAITRGLVVRSGGRKVRFGETVRAGALTVTPVRATSRVTITLAAPAVRITAAEAARIRRRQVTALRLRVTAVTSAKQRSTHTIEITGLT